MRITLVGIIDRGWWRSGEEVRQFVTYLVFRILIRPNVYTYTYE